MTPKLHLFFNRLDSVYIILTYLKYECTQLPEARSDANKRLYVSIVLNKEIVSSFVHKLWLLKINTPI